MAIVKRYKVVEVGGSDLPCVVWDHIEYESEEDAINIIRDYLREGNWPRFTFSVITVYRND